MQNAGLDEAQAGIKHKLESRFPGEISINLRYADDATLKTESEEELKSLLMKVKEEREKMDLNSTFNWTSQVAQW